MPDFPTLPNSSPTANPEAYLRLNDVRLRDISVVSQNGQDMSIMNQYAVFEITEDLFQNNLSGVISNIDASNIVSNFPLTGEEFLIISFGTPGSSEEIELLFLIDKVIDRAPLKNKQSQFYDIHVVCPTFLLNLFSDVSKSYTGTVSNAVKDIFTNHINGEEASRKKLITNEATSGEQHLIIPSWNAFTSINWLAKRAMSENNPKSCDYVFYQDLDGFHFRSISSLFDKEVSQTYIFGADNAIDFIRDDPNSQINMQKSYQNIRKLVASGFDRSKETMWGAYSSNVMIHDIVTKSYSKVDYKYLDDFDQKSSLNNNPIMSKGNIYSNKPNSKKYFVPSHLNLYGEPSESEENSGTDGIENWLPRHDAQLLQLCSSSIEIDVAGDTSRRVGDKVTAIVNSFEGVDQQGRVKLDHLITGDYIITKIKHTIHKTEGHKQKMKLCKESNIEPTSRNLSIDSGPSSDIGNILQ
tara:strand:- start:323 stop:1726 length:1404 start_codon:yes stop_codon:yes gene_type:complete